MKPAALLVAVLAAHCVAFKAFASTPPAAPQVVGCDDQPHRIVTDPKTGRPAQAVFFCYRDDGAVIHVERALTFDEILALITPKPAPTPAANTAAAPAPVAVPAAPAKP